MRLGIYPPILRIKPESIIIFTSSNRETYQLIREKVICVKICQRFLAVWSTNTQSRRNLVFFFEIRPINIVTNVFGPLFFWRTNDKKWLSTYGRIAWLAWLKRPVTASATESASYTACDWVIGKKANFWVYIIRSGRAKWKRIFGGDTRAIDGQLRITTSFLGLCSRLALTFTFTSCKLGYIRHSQNEKLRLSFCLCSHLH